MRISVVLAAFAAIGLVPSVASGQINITSGFVSGFSGGDATPIAGGPTITADEMNTPFTVNAAQTSGSGGTSGGLGEAGVIGQTSVVFTVTSEQARGGGGPLLRFHGTGMAQFDSANYTGGIASSFELSAVFFTIGGTGPMEFALIGSGGWASLPNSGTMQPITSTGASINGNMLTPGTYIVSIQSIFVGAASSGPQTPSFDGELVLIVPTMPTVAAVGIGAGLLARRRR